jgi:hypothetical protein
MVKHKMGTWWPDDWEVEWHGVWSAPCTRRRGARDLGLASKPSSTVSPGLASKLVASGFLVWSSKPAAGFW